MFKVMTGISLLALAGIALARAETRVDAAPPSGPIVQVGIALDHKVAELRSELAAERQRQQETGCCALDPGGAWLPHF
ncbi:MAG: hypothetical protein JSR60_10640 [Proteobacteria bacterium]|nr:hypothetical protein [Pseudomonadota bacterium]